MTLLSCYHQISNLLCRPTLAVQAEDFDPFAVVGVVGAVGVAAALKKTNFIQEYHVYMYIFMLMSCMSVSYECGFCMALFITVARLVRNDHLQAYHTRKSYGRTFLAEESQVEDDSIVPSLTGKQDQSYSNYCCCYC